MRGALRGWIGAMHEDGRVAEARAAAIAVTTVLALAATGLLAGCSDEDGPSRGGITRALDAALAREHPACFIPPPSPFRDPSLPVSWPLRLGEGRVRAGLEKVEGAGQRAPLPPLLRAMERAGYVRVEHVSEPSGINDGLLFAFALVTPTEPAKRWWDPERGGWCAGRPAVAEVQEWTLPAKGSPQPVAVRFTWHLVEVPAWARRPEFADLRGMNAPMPVAGILVHTSSGWRVP